MKENERELLDIRDARGSDRRMKDNMVTKLGVEGHPVSQWKSLKDKKSYFLEEAKAGRNKPRFNQILI